MVFISGQGPTNGWTDRVVTAYICCIKSYIKPSVLRCSLHSAFSLCPLSSHTLTKSHICQNAVHWLISTFNTVFPALQGRGGSLDFLSVICFWLLFSFFFTKEFFQNLWGKIKILKIVSSTKYFITWPTCWRHLVHTLQAVVTVPSSAALTPLFWVSPTSAI